MSFSIVFGGGGCRTFWGMGVLDSLGWPQPTEWAGVSAGSAMCLIASTGRVDKALAGFVEATRANRSNIYPLHAFRRRHKVFPHNAMYRGVLRDALHAGGWDALQAASPVRVLLAYVKPGAPFARSVLGALNGYRRRSKSYVLHGDAQLPGGIGTETVTLQAASSRSDVVDTIMSSSATWPVTPLPVMAGRRYIDAGAVDGLPIRALTAQAQRGKILVLLADRFPEGRLPTHPNRLYIGPQAEPVVSMWDYASPDRVLRTFEAGQRHGERVRTQIEDFIQGWRA